MKKASLLTALGLALVLSVAAPKASAGVVLGVRVGTPAYVGPAYVSPGYLTPTYVGPDYLTPGYVAPVRYRYYAPQPYVMFRHAPVYRRFYVAPGFRARWYGPRYVQRRGFYGWRR